MKSRTFVDSVIVYARGGNGGNGCVSFRREKYIPRGGPDGGDGGDGGSVIFKADRETDSLLRLYYTPHQRAERGEHGKGKTLTGRCGRDLVVKIPCGTEIWNAETGVMLADIVRHGDEFVAAKGGRGGLGNCHWKTATHRAPTEHTNGGEGEEVTLRLELKLIADAGLVGFPNAGKSSLLTVVSDAHPKVAAYPFTTLHPVIGTVVYEDYTRLTIADLPGLIEDAHKGTGLGDAFLRHIERAPLLIYVVDMAGVDGRRPWDDYASLRKEMKLYRKDLVRRPCLVVANKMDLPEAKANLAKFKLKTKTRPLCFSAVAGNGLEELKKALYRLHRKKERTSNIQH